MHVSDLCKFSFGLVLVFLINAVYCQWGWQLPYPYACVERPVQAICRMQANPNVPFASGISGIVIFTQRITCYGHYALQIKASISGLPADGNWTYHGFHIHQSGDMSNGCESMGPHFNPFNTVHGSQRDSVNRRHVGDLGNVVKDPYGNIQAAIFDNLASLVGRNSILRRGIVLHATEDDLGRGNNEESLRTGNAGRRLACCFIEPL
ncbi:SOD-1 superoxide dismutase (Cu-Zn) [Mactra antiquata]